MIRSPLTCAATRASSSSSSIPARQGRRPRAPPRPSRRASPRLLQPSVHAAQLRLSPKHEGRRRQGVRSGETRVAVVPDTARRLVGDGVEVLVERGAGEAATFSDAAYEEAGARVVSGDELYAGADLVCKVRKPSAEEVARLRDGQVLRRAAAAARRPRARAGARRARRDRLLDGLDPAHHPRPADGRALVAEHRRRLQGRPSSRPSTSASSSRC